MRYSNRKLANITSETSGTNYHDIEELHDHKYFGVQIEIGISVDTVTVTLEGTMQDDGTALASRDWQDITYSKFGVASILSTTGVAKSDMFVYDVTCPFAAIRVKTVSSGGNDDANYVINLAAVD